MKVLDAAGKLQQASQENIQRNCCRICLFRMLDGRFGRQQIVHHSVYFHQDASPIKRIEIARCVPSAPKFSSFLYKSKLSPPTTQKDNRSTRKCIWQACSCVLSTLPYRLCSCFSAAKRLVGRGDSSRTGRSGLLVVVSEPHSEKNCLSVAAPHECTDQEDEAVTTGCSTDKETQLQQCGAPAYS